ncbi:hypothetical protein KIN20_023094 [Parelaphostrongylus tenuis]|uniref:Uncharacterized protein n=1 Tax=Parelaphostrongylus tenuis TaxID=148309 RepID=A0AAD5QX54_PARTN|nr:hypothetical protein KIN20_023094 [Parelaphostrongylus tenuis]
MSRIKKDWEVIEEEDWEAFEDEELKTMFQDLTVSADEDIGDESDPNMNRNMHTPQGSEDDDDGSDDAQRALFNVHPPILLSSDAYVPGESVEYLQRLRENSVHRFYDG